MEYACEHGWEHGGERRSGENNEDLLGFCPFLFSYIFYISQNLKKTIKKKTSFHLKNIFTFFI